MGYFITGSEEQSWAWAKEPESEHIPCSDTAQLEGSPKLQIQSTSISIVIGIPLSEKDEHITHPSQSADCQFATGCQEELMFLDFTQCISLLIKTSYKKVPTKCWELCTLIWKRLINFYTFMAFTSPQDVFPWWYSASDYLPTQTCICSRGQYTGDSAGSLQGGNEWSVFHSTLQNVFLYQYESACRGLNRHADPQSDYFLLS